MNRLVERQLASEGSTPPPPSQKQRKDPRLRKSLTSEARKQGQHQLNALAVLLIVLYGWGWRQTVLIHHGTDTVSHVKMALEDWKVSSAAIAQRREPQMIFERRYVHDNEPIKRFPREPSDPFHSHDDCMVTFHDPRMFLCYYEENNEEPANNLLLLSDVLLALVDQLLAYRFPSCEIDVPRLNLAKTSHPERLQRGQTCMFLQTHLYKLTHRHPGDVVLWEWEGLVTKAPQDIEEEKEYMKREEAAEEAEGEAEKEAEREAEEEAEETNEDDEKDILAVFLIPFVFQDYYWLPTASIRHPPFYRSPKNCHFDDTSLDAPGGPSESLEKHWSDWVQQLCLCDTLTSSSKILLLWANALGLPHRPVHDDYSTLLGRTLGPFRDTTVLDPADGWYRAPVNSSSIMWLSPSQQLEQQKRHEIAWTMAQSIFKYDHFVTRRSSELTDNSEADEPPSHNSTLVIIMGNLRGGERTWSTLYRHVLDLNQADLALVIGESDPFNSTVRTTSLWHRAKYLYEFPEYKDWGDAIDEEFSPDSTVWRRDLLERHDPKWGAWGGVKGYNGSGTVIFMIRHYVSKLLEEQNLLRLYDRFVLTRSDHYYGCPHDLALLDPRFMWVPKGEDYNHGITDRHLVANRAQILYALNILYPIVTNPDKYSSREFALLNPERLLRFRWEQEQLWGWVRRFPRVMFTCAVPGDTTRWTKPFFDALVQPEGVHLKYPYEYEETKCICGGNCNITMTRRRMRAGY